MADPPAEVRRTGLKNIHVRDNKEEGAKTPFDMVVLNDLDRFHLCEDVIDRHQASDSSSPLASTRSGVVKPSVYVP